MTEHHDLQFIGTRDFPLEKGKALNFRAEPILWHTHINSTLRLKSKIKIRIPSTKNSTKLEACYQNQTIDMLAIKSQIKKTKSLKESLLLKKRQFTLRTSRANPHKVTLFSKYRVWGEVYCILHSPGDKTGNAVLCLYNWTWLLLTTTDSYWEKDFLHC